MISIARAILLHDKVRFLITVAGLGFVMLMVVYNFGVFFGTVGESVSVVDHAGADLWVLEEGHSDIFAPSHVSDNVLKRARTLDGVRHACGLNQLGANLEIAENHEVQVIGIDLGCPLIQPWDVVAGDIADLRRPDTVAVDDFLLKSDPARLGDTIEVNGRDLRIVAITHYNKGFFTPYVYVNTRTFMSLGGTPETSNFVAIRLEPGADPAPITQRLTTANSAISVFGAEEFKTASTVALVTSGLGAIFTVVAVGALVGTLIIALTIYTATLEQLRDFAVLKAIGAPGRKLVSIVLEEAVTETTVGFGCGLAASLAMNYLVERSVGMKAIFPLPMIVGCFAGMVALAVLASLLSIRKAVAVDPVLVFRA